eukprot:13435338-Alexandrium_andersonii.AAC.1
MVRSATFYHDVMVKELLEPKSVTDGIKKEINVAGLGNKCVVLPPINPWADAYRAPSKLAFKTLMAEVENAREDMDGKLPPEYRCRTQYPVDCLLYTSPSPRD